MRDFIRLKSFNAVGARQRATLDVPPTDIYHSLHITHKRSGVLATQAQMEAEIERIEIEINGTVQRSFTPAQLFKMHALYGVAVSAGHIPIYFSEPWARSAQGEDSKAWGTQDVETFTVVVKLASGATAPSLECHAEVELGNRPMGLIEKWSNYTVPVSAIGVTPWNPNIEPLDSYYGITAFSGDITDFSIRVDNRDRKEASLALLNATLTNKELVPQTDVVHMLFNDTLRVSDSLPMKLGQNAKVRNFRVDFTLDAANSFEVITQTLGRPN